MGGEGAGLEGEATGVAWLQQVALAGCVCLPCAGDTPSHCLPSTGRSGSTEGLPQPPSWEEALARKQQHGQGQLRQMVQQQQQRRGKGRKQQE